METVNYTQDQLYASKLATEKGLLEIGKILEKEKTKKEKLEQLHKELIESIEECRNGTFVFTKRNVKKKFKDFNEYVTLTEEKTLELVKNISTLEDQLSDEQEENSNYFDEIEENEKQIEELKVKNLKLTNHIWWYKILVQSLFICCLVLKMV